MTSRHSTSVMAAAALVAFLGLLPVAALAAKGGPAASETLAKDVFHRPADTSGPVQLALKYTILLQRGETLLQVPTDYVFKSGDRFRILLQGNTPGHLYLLHRGSTGAGRFLFPNTPLVEGQNLVPAYRQNMVPGSGWFEFDEHPGVETLHIILAPEPVNELRGLVGMEPIPPSRFQQAMDTLVLRWQRVADGRLTKDIVYVDEGQTVIPAAQPEQAQRVTPAGPTQAVRPAQLPAPSVPPVPTLTADVPAQPRPAPVASTTGPTVPRRGCHSDRPSPAAAAASNTVPFRNAWTYVAQAPGGSGKLLLHTVTLKHE